MNNIEVIFIPEHSGFCFGVERALRLAKKVKRTSKGKKGEIFTFGPLIHNPAVVEELANEGIRPIDSEKDLSSVRDSTLVIRTHGARPEIFSRAQELNITLVDATCPYVRAVQKCAANLYKQGYLVVIVGNPNHPEVQSILGYTNDSGVIFTQDALKTGKINKRRIGIIAQTTIPGSQFREAILKITELDFMEVRVFNTICEEAQERQASCYEISQKADCMIVVGGKASSNTTRLKEIAHNLNKPTFHIEDTKELFEIERSLAEGRLLPAGGRDKLIIGVVSGTSTPASLVAKVVETIKRWSGAPQKAALLSFKLL